MKTYAVACETGVIVEADGPPEIDEDGRLIFYLDGKPPIEFPDGVWLDWSEVDG